MAILADAHIGGPGGPAGPLIEQLDALPVAGCERLVLLGDLFHIWVGSPKFETPDHRLVLGALARIGDAGVRLDYVEGNRDFFIAESAYATLFTEVAVSVAFEAGGRRYLAIHGDGLDPSDRKYRFWNRLSKSRLSRSLWLGLPSSLARWLAESTERRLADTNFQHKIEVPEEVLRRFALERLAEGHDEILLGHFHRPLRFELGAGTLRVVDAWFNTRALEWLA